jgi:hypothetical protein
MDDRGLAIKQSVRVWEGEEPVEITVVKKSKTVWVAVGQYMGKEVRAQGRSANSATALWKDAAHYRSN